MAKPIFLVGWRRSGTTWLGNLISQNTNIASIMGGKPGEMGGCVESFYFSHLAGKFGDLKNCNNRIYFIEVFGSCTYYELSGLGKAFLYEKKPLSYADAFRFMMDRYAELKGTDFWFEKNPSHSFHVEEIADAYQDAKIVAIKRDIIGQVRSALKINKIEGVEAEGLKAYLYVLKEIISYYMAFKHIDHFKAKHPEKMLIVYYAELVGDTEGVLTTICDFLGLEFEPAMLKSPYKAATSFKSEEERHEILPPAQEKMLKILAPIFALIPYSLYKIFYRTAKKIQGLHFPHWFFSTKLEQYGWDDIYNPERTGDLVNKPTE